MPLPSVVSLLTTPLHSRQAPVIAGALGAAVGATFAMSLQGITNIGPGTLFGGLLGMGWTGLQQYMERCQALRRTPPPEVRELTKYPAVRVLLRRHGAGVDDPAALLTLSIKLEADIKKMTQSLDAYCRTRGVPDSPLVAKALRHFYLTHCSERGIALLSKATSPYCYLVAAKKADEARLKQFLNDENVAAGTKLRQMGCPYMRIDLALETLRGAREFAITEDSGGEMHVHVATTPFEIGAMVNVIRRRRKGQQGAHDTASVSPDGSMPVEQNATCSANVMRGPRLKKKLAELALPPESRTWQDLKRIEQDLAAHRPCGHAIRHNGQHCYSVDIHLDGHWAPGRNRWRLLYQRVPGGYRLIDIDDPHASRH